MRVLAGQGSNQRWKASLEPALGVASRLVLVGLSLIVALSLASCGSSTKVRGEVMKTLVSPNSDVTATLTRGDYGATVPWVYRVYLNARGDPRQVEVLSVVKQDGLTVRWDSDDSLTIHMTCGMIWDFSNYYEIAVADRYVRTITVHLENGGLCPDEG